jgi:serine-type D-Ala-D-Ala carboxypeptidase/endopeptidase (penicillin-binding protein 4)
MNLLRTLTLLSAIMSALLPTPLFAQLASSSPLDAFKKAGIASDSVGLYALALDQTIPKFAHNPDQAFVLASTTKIITSIAALDVLGPGFKWRTNAYLNGTLENGVLSGDLLIVGGGDPLLDYEKLVAWFKLLQKRGLKEIAGNIILDRHRFALVDKDHINTPKPEWRNPHHALPDALVVGEGTLKVQIANIAGTKVITLDPPIEGIDLVDQTKSIARCANSKLAISVEFVDASAPPKALVTGDWAPDCPSVAVETNPLDQISFSGAAIAAAWKAAGGTLTGSIIEQAPPVAVKAIRVRTRGKASKPPRARKAWSTLESKQLLDAIKQVNKWSNNLVSRNVLLSLSEGFPNRAATLQSAQKNIDIWLQSKGFNDGDLKVENGSGLSRNEKGRPRALAQLLRDVTFTKIDGAFRSSLSIAGVDGTMGSRLKRSEFIGKILIKTGTLTDVRAIAGYVTSKSGQVYAVVGIVNHANTGRALQALDSFIEWVHHNG